MQEVLNFLKALAQNNNREWFAANKDKYQSAAEAIKTLTGDIAKKLAATDNISAVKTFRIYRDVRFSKNKAPYKTNSGTVFYRAEPALKGAYYLHIEPGKSFIGGGFWHPDPKDVQRIRKEFELNPAEIRAIVSTPAFKKFFGNITGDELKTAPKGFDKNLEAIDLIRKKEFIVMRPLADREVINPGLVEDILDTYLAMRPFLDYMTDVLTTDLNGESVV